MSGSMEAGKLRLWRGKPAQKGRPLAIQVMIESPWSLYFIRTLWFSGESACFLAKSKCWSTFSTSFIYVHQFSSIFCYLKSPFGPCQSCCSRSPSVTLGFLALSCKEPGLLEAPWGTGASSAAWGKPVLLRWGCSLQWEVPDIFWFCFTIEHMRQILVGGCATGLKHMSQMEKLKIFQTTNPH